MEKRKTGIFDGPQINKLIKDAIFDVFFFNPAEHLLFGCPSSQLLRTFLTTIKHFCVISARLRKPVRIINFTVLLTGLQSQTPPSLYFHYSLLQHLNLISVSLPLSNPAIQQQILLSHFHCYFHHITDEKLRFIYTYFSLWGVDIPS